MGKVLRYAGLRDRSLNRILVRLKSALDKLLLKNETQRRIPRGESFRNFSRGERQRQHLNLYQEPDTQKRQHRENGNTKKLQHQDVTFLKNAECDISINLQHVRFSTYHKMAGFYRRRRSNQTLE